MTLFPASAALSFVAMRQSWRFALQSDKLEASADTVLVVGPGLMVFATILLVPELL